MEVECIGHWKEGSTRYFVGRLEGRRAVTDEDRYRCFAWERVRDNKDPLDYRMAQSGDATCNGVFSAYDGAKNLRISKGKLLQLNHEDFCTVILFTFTSFEVSGLTS